MPQYKNTSPAPPKPWPMTTRQVMGHLAGIRHDKSGSQDDLKLGTRNISTTQFKAWISLRTTRCYPNPASAFHDSSHGYTVVGCVIDGASGAK